jgi:hypothetical protein
MPETNPIRSTRDFVVLSNLNAVGATTANAVNANNFTIQFNNTNFTNVQANAGDGTIVKMYPQLCTLDLNYFNISAVFENNKFIVSGATLVASPVTIIIPDGIYNIVSEGSWNSGVSPQDTEWNSIYTQTNNGNNFRNNVIGNNFENNIIGDNFEDNQIGFDFQSNEIILKKTVKKN